MVAFLTGIAGGVLLISGLSSGYLAAEAASNGEQGAAIFYALWAVAPLAVGSAILYSALGFKK